VTLELRPEEAFLVTAAAGRCRPPVQGALDWDAVVPLATWHRLLPLAHDHVRAHPDLVVPDAVRAALRDGAREQAARGLHLQAELDRVLALLAEREIPALLLKGAALVGEVYPDASLRPMVDLDLLVPRDAVQAAHEAVQELGYGVGGASLHRDDAARVATMHHHFPLVKRGGSMMVELHHGLVVDRPQYDVEGLWTRARPGQRAVPCLLPATEDLFLHVAVHFAFDRIQRGESALGQLADVVRVAGRFPLDWGEVVARARANDVADRLFLALLAADALAGEVAPPAVLDELRPPSFAPELGEGFVRQRVLAAQASLPLEQLSGGLRRLFPGRAALERYVRIDEGVPPSVVRLRVRRYRALARRLRHELPAPRRLVADVRLSRWLLTLRE
jgi:hypothetical protein